MLNPGLGGVRDVASIIFHPWTDSIKPSLLFLNFAAVFPKDLFSTMAQTAHFSFQQQFTIPNSEFWIPYSEFRIPNSESEFRSKTKYAFILAITFI